MSDNDRGLLVNSDTMASNPGRTAVQWPVFIRCFSRWFIIFPAVIVGAGLLALTTQDNRLWIISLSVFVIGLLGIARTRSQFNLGCVNPTQVVGKDPYLIAVYTDLTTGGETYDVVKILKHPLHKMTGGPPQVGQRLASVALYQGDIHKAHWDDFDPVAVNCVTASRADIERTLNSIPADEWECLEEGLKQVPQPYRPGLYPVDLSRHRAMQAQGARNAPAPGAACTLVSPTVDYAGIVRTLRALRPNLQVVGDENRWSQILIYGNRSTLCINSLESQYPGDQLSQITQGLYQQFHQVRTQGVQNQQHALGVIQSTRMALGVTATPAFSEEDRHFQCLHAVARHLNGLIFTGIALVDGNGRMILNVNGTYQQGVE